MSFYQELETEEVVIWCCTDEIYWGNYQSWFYGVYILESYWSKKNADCGDGLWNFGEKLKMHEL